MDVIEHGGSAATAARPEAGAAVSTAPRRRPVRADLEEVFRTAYPRVVAVAARVLGSRDEAEDVAQEVFLAFGRSSVPAGEALGLAVRRRGAHRAEPPALRPSPRLP